MFIDDCELEFGFLQNYGYKLEQKESNNKYEQIIWNKRVNKRNNNINSSYIYNNI